MAELPFSEYTPVPKVPNHTERSVSLTRAVMCGGGKRSGQRRRMRHAKARS